MHYRGVEMNCPKCNSQVNQGEKYCNQCGANIYGDNYTKKVGTDNYIDSKDYAEFLLQQQLKKENSSSSLKIVLAVLITVVIIFVVGIVLFLFLGNKSNGQEEKVNTEATTTATGVADSKKVTVPAVAGHEYVLAKQWLENVNLQISYVSEYSDNIPKDYVIRQTPSAGTELKEGEIVSLIVSKGKYTSIDYSTYNIPSTAKTSSGYVIPDSSSRYLTYSDINGLDSSALELARNEIYARHGRRFSTSRLQQYFNTKTWYVGAIDPDDFDEGCLNKYELANIKYLLNQESYISNNGSYEDDSAAGNTKDRPVFTSISATSTLPTDSDANYNCKNMMYDNDSCWSEGVSGVGIGESITLSNSKTQHISGISIKNGVSKSESLFKKNGRVLKMRFDFSNGDVIYRNIADTRELQHIYFGKTISTTYIKMTIEDACSGTKYDDTCITLLMFF